MKDRVARQKNQEQDDRLTALEARVTAVAADVAHLGGLVDPLFPAVRDLRARVEALEGSPTDPPDEPPTDPPDEPATGWKLKWALDRISKWDSVLRQEYPGNITEANGETRFFIDGPGPHRPGGRMEVQSHKPEHGGCPIPGEQAYEWEFLIESREPSS